MGELMKGWMMPVISQKTNNVFFLSILAVAAALRLAFAPGLSGNDDIALAMAAIRVLDHGLHLPSGHYEARLGLILPLAAIFRLFGVGIAQLIFLPMAASLLGVFLAYRIGAFFFNQRTGLVAAAVLALYPMDATYAGLFFPDLVQGVALAAALLLALEGSARPDGTLWCLGAALCWAYAYYVKIDAFFMGLVFLLTAFIGYIRWRDIIIIFAATLALVGLELVIYGALTGSIFYHAELEHQAANEVLAPGMDYRDLLIYPAAMFFDFHETSVHFYVLGAAIGLVAWTRSRPGYVLAGWCLIFLAWLMLGVDPFGSFRLKAQISRYLLSFTIPMCVLAGWALVWVYEHLSRRWVIGFCVAGGMLSLVAMPMNVLAFTAARATAAATEAALSRNYFPLYTDVQSYGIVKFLLHGTSQEASVHQVQHHDFLRGVTTFDAINEPKGYLLINYDYMQRLQKRNLVTPLTPSQFGMGFHEVLSVDQASPPLAYALYGMVTGFAGHLPIPWLENRLKTSADDVLRPGHARLFALERAATTRLETPSEFQ